MRHVLRRHAAAEAARAITHCEAVYAAVMPGLAGELGLRFYHEFTARMRAIIHPPALGQPQGTDAAEIAAFDAIAARARFNPRQTGASTAR